MFCISSVVLLYLIHNELLLQSHQNLHLERILLWPGFIVMQRGRLHLIQRPKEQNTNIAIEMDPKLVWMMLQKQRWGWRKRNYGGMCPLMNQYWSEQETHREQESLQHTPATFGWLWFQSDRFTFPPITFKGVLWEACPSWRRTRLSIFISQLLLLSGCSGSQLSQKLLFMATLQELSYLVLFLFSFHSLLVTVLWVGIRM